MATEEELGTTAAVARTTGVLLDPVYSGKAVHGLLREMAEDTGAWDGRVVLFVHTGGALGMYDKLDQLRPIMETIGPSRGYDFTELDTA
jgi:1-aminocyclopropane-1-carboxylate deaminase/D-cysteine desulfhydrase-like pyridoxal-dependent ACC family enzyme